MKIVFLIAALALPPAKQAGFDLLEKMIASYRPGYQIVLVNRNEKLIGGEWTPVVYKDLQVWLVRAA